MYVKEKDPAQYRHVRAVLCAEYSTVAFGLIEHSGTYITAWLCSGVKFRVVILFFLDLYLNLYVS